MRLQKFISGGDNFMSLADKVVYELRTRHLFLSSMHYEHFMMLIDRVKDEPFFCRELCKCAFLAAWDQNHAIIFDQTMTELCNRKATSLQPMLEKGEALLPKLPHSEKALFQMSCDFIKYPGQTPDESVLLTLTNAWVSIADNALEASRVIDHLTDR